MVCFLIELVRIISHVNSLYCHLERIWLYILFFAVENTLSDGAVDARIAKYFLASLEIIGKDVPDISTTSKDHLCESLFPPPSGISAYHLCRHQEHELLLVQYYLSSQTIH